MLSLRLTYGNEGFKEIKEFLSKRLKRSFGQEVDISFRYEKKERKIDRKPEIYTVVRKKEEKENEHMWQRKKRQEIPVCFLAPMWKGQLCQSAILWTKLEKSLSPV